MSLTWQRSAEQALAIGAFASLPLAVPAPLGLAPLMILLAAVAGIGAIADRRAAMNAFHGLDRLWLIFAVVSAWGLVTALWSIAPERSLEMAVRLAVTSLAGLLLLAAALGLPGGARERLAFWLVLGSVLGTALLTVEIATNLGLLRLIRGSLGDRPPIDVLLNRAATLLVLLEWPVAIALWRRSGPWTAGLWLAAVVAVLVYLASASALFASLVGLGIGAAALVRPWFVRGALAGLSVAGILLAPLAGLSVATIEQLSPWVKASGVHRLVIWSFVSARIAERPIAGWGLDTSRMIPGGDGRIAVMTRQGVMQAEALPLHPHNAALQWWLELGLPGALLGALLVVLVLRAIPLDWGRLEAAALLALVAAGLVISMLSYGIWQFWWMAALWLAAAFAVAVIRPTDTPS